MILAMDEKEVLGKADFSNLILVLKIAIVSIKVFPKNVSCQQEYKREICEGMGKNAKNFCWNLVNLFCGYSSAASQKHRG